MRLSSYSSVDGKLYHFINMGSKFYEKRNRNARIRYCMLFYVVVIVIIIIIDTQSTWSCGGTTIDFYQCGCASLFPSLLNCLSMIFGSVWLFSFDSYCQRIIITGAKRAPAQLPAKWTVKINWMLFRKLKQKISLLSQPNRNKSNQIENTSQQQLAQVMIRHRRERKQTCRRSQQANQNQWITILWYTFLPHSHDFCLNFCFDQIRICMFAFVYLFNFFMMKEWNRKIPTLTQMTY